MSTDSDIPQDPGIPGTKVPEQLPPQDEPEVERVPDSGQPDYDEEGSRNPKGTTSGAAPILFHRLPYFASEIGISTTCVFDPSAAERS